jgi:putative glycosyltransferase (TIGR04348 family)
MKICVVTPAPPGSRKGNRITAVRWARLLRELGHRVQVCQAYEGSHCDVLLALHARRSAESIARFRRKHPDKPLVLALTGTDLYGDIHTDPVAQRSLELASRFILLQPAGIEELAQRLRDKARVIYQSVELPRHASRSAHHSSGHHFEVCVLGHLRAVKDPFRTAQAARLLPEESCIRVTQVGGALSADMAEQARGEQASNPRYRWLGELPRWKALRALARSDLLVLTSQMEGGANVISEALAVGVPVISSRISGSVGLLGTDYPGYFPVGDTQGLAKLLWRAETDPQFYRALQKWCVRLRPLIDPARERRGWRSLLRELSVSSVRPCRPRPMRPLGRPKSSPSTRRHAGPPGSPARKR